MSSSSMFQFILLILNLYKDQHYFENIHQKPQNTNFVIFQSETSKIMI